MEKKIIIEEICLGNRIVIMGFFTKSVAGAKVGIPCWLGRRRGKKREERKKRNTKSPHIFEKKKQSIIMSLINYMDIAPCTLSLH